MVSGCFCPRYWSALLCRLGTPMYFDPYIWEDFELAVGVRSMLFHPLLYFSGDRFLYNNLFGFSDKTKTVGGAGREQETVGGGKEQETVGGGQEWKAEDAPGETEQDAQQDEAHDSMGDSTHKTYDDSDWYSGGWGEDHAVSPTGEVAWSPEETSSGGQEAETTTPDKNVIADDDRQEEVSSKDHFYHVVDYEEPSEKERRAPDPYPFCFDCKGCAPALNLTRLEYAADQVGKKLLFRRNAVSAGEAGPGSVEYGALCIVCWRKRAATELEQAKKGAAKVLEGEGKKRARSLLVRENIGPIPRRQDARPEPRKEEDWEIWEFPAPNNAVLLRSILSKIKSTVPLPSYKSVCLTLWLVLVTMPTLVLLGLLCGFACPIVVVWIGAWNVAYYWSKSWSWRGRTSLSDDVEYRRRSARVRSWLNQAWAVLEWTDPFVLLERLYDFAAGMYDGIVDVEDDGASNSPESKQGAAGVESDSSRIISHLHGKVRIPDDTMYISVYLRKVRAPSSLLKLNAAFRRRTMTVHPADRKLRRGLPLPRLKKKGRPAEDPREQPLGEHATVDEDHRGKKWKGWRDTTTDWRDTTTTSGWNKRWAEGGTRSQQWGDNGAADAVGEDGGAEVENNPQTPARRDEEGEPDADVEGSSPQNAEDPLADARTTDRTPQTGDWQASSDHQQTTFDEEDEEDIENHDTADAGDCYLLDPNLSDRQKYVRWWFNERSYVHVCSHNLAELEVELAETMENGEENASKEQTRTPLDLSDIAQRDAQKLLSQVVDEELFLELRLDSILDSLLVIALSNRIRVQLARKISAQKILSMRTVVDLVEELRYYWDGSIRIYLQVST